MRVSRRSGLALAVVAALALAACSSGKSTGGSSATTPPAGSSSAAGGGSSASAGGSCPFPTDQVTLTWWHNATSDPGKSEWQKTADDFHAQHPNVSFKVVPIQNEQFVTKVPAALESNDPPSLYQQWGGGAEATQVKSGKLMDMTACVSSWVDRLGPSAKGWQVDGKWYGIPYDYHIVGFWYRTDLFQKAGITSPPQTMDEFYQDIEKLKAAGITPIAVGGKDRWPEAFYWEYFVLRECPKDTVTSSIANVKFSDPCFIKAGEDMKKFLDAKPFQTGFLGTPAQQGAGSSAGLVANGKAAMELQGDWEIVVMPSLTEDKNFASKLGWFPFPSVPGGAGDQKAGLGGGDGFSCTYKATNACPAFLEYITRADVQRELIKKSTISLPSNGEASDAITDPTLKSVLQYLQNVEYNQLYFDQALPTSAGQALNSAIADFFAGSGSPQSIAQSVSK
ncbi:MAG: extracellular solute-binding protein [Acidothermus sp.]|nr:extracellular solute-binding protein [Acidothermus sp.]